MGIIFLSPNRRRVLIMWLCKHGPHTVKKYTLSKPKLRHFFHRGVAEIALSKHSLTTSLQSQKLNKQCRAVTKTIGLTWNSAFKKYLHWPIKPPKAHFLIRLSSTNNVSLMRAYSMFLCMRVFVPVGVCQRVCVHMTCIILLYFGYRVL